MPNGVQEVNDAAYRAHYADRLAEYESRDHLDRHTRGVDDYPRFRCDECGAAITIDPSKGIEYGHYSSQSSSYHGGTCPFRPGRTEAGGWNTSSSDQTARSD